MLGQVYDIYSIDTYEVVDYDFSSRVIGDHIYKKTQSGIIERIGNWFDTKMYDESRGEEIKSQASLLRTYYEKQRKLYPPDGKLDSLVQTVLGNK